MIKKILMGLGAVIVVFLGVVAMQPGEFKLERSTAMAAPADVVFAQVNDFHAWAAWSPWEKMEGPTLKKTFEGSPSGQGSMYSWVGEKTGEGKMTITAAKPSEQIDIKLDFIKPFEASNQVIFTFKPDGAQTKVTWAMTGQNNFMGKAMGLFMDMDSMVGKDFEAGLASLRSVSEAAAKKAAEGASAAAAPGAEVAAPAQP
jgi:hypothetical protein